MNVRNSKNKEKNPKIFKKDKHQIYLKKNKKKISHLPECHIIMNNCLQKGKEKAFLNSHSVPKLSSKSEGKVKTFQTCKDSEHISHTLRL